MKITIWEKDDFFQFTNGPRIDMDPMVVKFGTDTMALVWAYEWDRKPLGQVENIVLEDGAIVGEATFFETEMEAHVKDLLEHKFIRFGGFYNQVQRKGVGDNKEIVLECELKAVSIVSIATYPIPELRKE